MYLDDKKKEKEELKEELLRFQKNFEVTNGRKMNKASDILPIK